MTSNLGVLLFFLLKVCAGPATDEQQGTCVADDRSPTCLQSKVDSCISQSSEVVRQLEASCSTTCLSSLGPNASKILQCLNAYEDNKLKMKAKKLGCVQEQAAKLSGASGTSPLGPADAVETEQQQQNFSDILHYKNDKLALKNNFQIKSFESCKKRCLKQMLNSNSAESSEVKHCVAQVYGLPQPTSLPKKAAKKLEKVCAEKSKFAKHAALRQLAVCLQMAASPGNTENEAASATGSGPNLARNDASPHNESAAAAKK